MESKILKFIQQHDLLKHGETVLVGLSGGADSIALSLVLKNLGFQVEAAHCNFHLRGEESDRDEYFVRQFCAAQSIPLTVTHFNTTEYANAEKVSIEMAARTLRYEFFHKLMKSANIAHLAVAHHQNDQAETVLLNLIRGTGIHGLRGMLPQNGSIIRPLLCVSREEILNFLSANGQSFVEDSSNQCTDYTRNRIRLELLPFLKELNPSIISGLNHTATVLSEVEQIYNESLKQQERELILTKTYELGKSPICLKREEMMMKSAKMKPLWHEILAPYGFTDSQIQSILSMDAKYCGKEFHTKEWILYVDRNSIAIKKRNNHLSFSTIICNNDKYIEFNQVKIQVSSLRVTDDPVIEKNPKIALFDADKVKYPLTLRTLIPGDRMAPFGMQGKKLISDILTNQKVPIWEKKEQLVLCASDGEILWLVGRRISSNHAISAQTQKILRFELY